MNILSLYTPTSLIASLHDPTMATTISDSCPARTQVCPTLIYSMGSQISVTTGSRYILFDGDQMVGPPIDLNHAYMIDMHKMILWKGDTIVAGHIGYPIVAPIGKLDRGHVLYCCAPHNVKDFLAVVNNRNRIELWIINFSSGAANVDQTITTILPYSSDLRFSAIEGRNDLIAISPQNGRIYVFYGLKSIMYPILAMRVYGELIYAEIDDYIVYFAPMRTKMIPKH